MARKRPDRLITRMDAPTAEQLSKGGYSRQFVTHTESATLATAYVSRHDPIERWISLNRLEEGQIRAIRHCQHLWHIASLPIKVTGNYGERIPVTGSVERLSNTQIDARESLYRIMDYFTGLEKWWNVFEQCARFGEPAGVAGSSLGYGDRSGADRAHTIVAFVSDVIATKERL